jgi:hypothetical protein
MLPTRGALEEQEGFINATFGMAEAAEQKLWQVTEKA